MAHNRRLCFPSSFTVLACGPLSRANAQVEADREAARSVGKIKTGMQDFRAFGGGRKHIASSCGNRADCRTERNGGLEVLEAAVSQGVGREPDREESRSERVAVSRVNFERPPPPGC